MARKPTPPTPKAELPKPLTTTPESIRRLDPFRRVRAEAAERAAMRVRAAERAAAWARKAEIMEAEAEAVELTAMRAEAAVRAEAWDAELPAEKVALLHDLAWEADRAVARSEAAKLTATRARAAELTAALAADRAMAEAEAAERVAARAEAAERAAELTAEKVAVALGGGNDGGPGTEWEIIQGLLLAKRERGEPYTTLRDLEKELGCRSYSMIRKAIGKSDTLKGWRSRRPGRTTAPKATGLDRVKQDDLHQTTEATPDDYLSDDDVDTAMALLIDQAAPEERARLNALDDAGRRALVAACEAQNLLKSAR